MATNKGSSFERFISEKLSLWWTENKRTDIFWRSSNSGGRATARKKVGKETSGQYGDLAAIDPIGSPLLKVCAIELKRGYSGHTISDLLDLPATATQQIYEEWFEKVIRSHTHASSFAWMLLVRRDRREAFCFIPNNLWVALRNVGAMKKLPFPLLSLTCMLRLKEGKKVITASQGETIIGFKFDDFLEETTPKHILDILTKNKGDENDLPKLQSGFPRA